MATEVILTPNWERTCRWFANAIITNSFDDGSVSPIISLIEQVRYLDRTNPDEVELILNELRERARLNNES